MISLQPKQRVETIAGACFAVVFLLFIFLHATTQISDPDFWWHLKTGEVMVQSGGLLQFDPFNFTGDGVTTALETVILKGYWLWQLTAYALYSLFGFNGIFLLNFLTFGAMAGVVIQEMRRQRVGASLAIVLITLGFSLMRVNYSLERPQVVSFLFAAILLAQLARVRDGGRLGWLLPLMMTVWANVHGGFVVGDIILLGFVAGAVIEYRQDLPRLQHLILWSVIGIGASLLNPNGALVFGELMAFKSSTISEFQSTWVRFQQGQSYYALLWLLIVLYGIGLWSARRLYWPELVVGLFLAYFSFMHVRNVGFFAVAMLPLIGFNLQQGCVLRSRDIPPLLKYIMIFLSVAALLWQTSAQWQKRSKEGVVSSFYPVESSNFILTSGLVGRMLNSYNFGGYEVWRFYPQHLVFIDGRGLHSDVFSDWQAMVSASLKEEGGRKKFEVLLDRYGIDYVVQPLIYFDNGRLTPLLKFLVVKPEWVPIYVDHRSFILVRNSQKNAEVIKRYQIDKRDFNNKIIGALAAICKNEPDKVTNHVALVEMLIFVGRYDEAEGRLAVIARLQPENPDLPSLRNQLAVLKSGKTP